MTKTSCYLISGILAAICICGCATPKNYTGLEPFSPVPNLASPTFYKPDGSFDQAVAKQAYFDLMRVGKNDAIVTEYATYHNDVKFSKPGMQFGNSKAAEITKLKK